MTIGVFDSGVGGLSVANAISAALPDVKIILREDKANLPYGNKTPEQLLGLVEPILQEMVQAGCEIIVIACNTVTTTIINVLRQRIDVPLIGMEPMVKPAAALTKSGTIAVFATPTTLGSKRYNELKSTYAQGVEVVEPDCSKWSYMIEKKEVNEKMIKQNVDMAINRGADVLVLGCTHYHWIEELIKELADGAAVVLQPEKHIIEQLKTTINTIR